MRFPVKLCGRIVVIERCICCFAIRYSWTEILKPSKQVTANKLPKKREEKQKRRRRTKRFIRWKCIISVATFSRVNINNIIRFGRFNFWFWNDFLFGSFHTWHSFSFSLSLWSVSLVVRYFTFYFWTEHRQRAISTHVYLKWVMFAQSLSRIQLKQLHILILKYLLLNYYDFVVVVLFLIFHSICSRKREKDW